MTEKRYVRILDHYEKEVRIFDEHNQKNIFNIFFMELDSAICLNGALEDTVDLLNYFYEEKKNLKEENEQLKQFKEEVFNKIDMHLRMLPTARDIEFNEDDGDPSLYVGAISMLETLKKELEE